MEENKQQESKKRIGEQNQEKTPMQPEKPAGNITSSNDAARLPDHVIDTPPEEQTKGNP